MENEENKDKIILILFDLTGNWIKPYKQNVYKEE